MYWLVWLATLLLYVLVAILVRVLLFLIVVLGIVILVYPLLGPKLVKKFGKKQGAKITFKGYLRVLTFSFYQSAFVHPAWDKIYFFLSNLRISRVNKKILLKVEELRVRIVYHHVEIDFKNHSLVGAEKLEMGENMFVNLGQIFKFYDEDKKKLTKMVDSKKTKIVSSKEKLKVKLALMGILKKYFSSTFAIFLARLIEIDISNLIVEFDRKDQNRDELFDKDSKMSSLYNKYFNEPIRRRWMKFDFRNLKLGFEDSVSDKLCTKASSEKGFISNFDEKQKEVLIASGKLFNVIMRRPLSLNATYAYLMSSFKVEIGESEFFFKDEQMPKFFTFILNIRLVNHIRAFIKKFDYKMGTAVDPIEDEEDPYKLQSSGKVDSNLVPTMPSKIKVHFTKTKWHLQFNQVDVEPLDYYNRLKYRKFLVEIDHFSICSRCVRKGNIIYPFSYEIKLDLGLEKLKGMYEKTGKTIFNITKINWKIVLKVFRTKVPAPKGSNVENRGLLDSNVDDGADKTTVRKMHDRIFSNEMEIESGQVYMNPASLLFYKFVTLFQINYANYNFAYYKEYLTNYLNTIRKTDPNRTEMISDILRKSIIRMSDKSELKDMEHLRSTLSKEEKELFFVADRGIFDVNIIRSKSVKSLILVICDTLDAPLCILRAKNILQRTTECYPYEMKFENIVKAENLILQDIDCTSEHDKIIGRIDEVVTTNCYTVWNDLDSYLLRNFEASLSSELLARLYLFGIKAKEQFGGLKIKSSRWVPRRKMLKDNAALKQDFILKLNVSNINLKINLEGDKYFMLNIASIQKEREEFIEPVISMLTLSNLEIGFSAPKWIESAGQPSNLITIPKIILKKNFSLNKDDICKGAKGTDPKLQKRLVSGFMLHDNVFQQFVKNYYLLAIVQNPNLTLPYQIQPVMLAVYESIAFIKNSKNILGMPARIEVPKPPTPFLNFFSMRVMLTIINLDISIEDSIISTTVLKRSIIMEKLEEKGLKKEDIDSKDFLNLLMQNEQQSKTTKLISLFIKEISLQVTAPFEPDKILKVSPLGQTVGLTQQEINSTKEELWRFVSGLGDTQLKIYETVISSLSGMSFQLYVLGVEVSLKNFPSKPVCTKFISIEGTYVAAAFKPELCDFNIAKHHGKNKHFYNLDVYMDEMNLAGGINLIHYYKAVLNYFKKMSSGSTEINENILFERVTSTKKRQTKATVLPEIENRYKLNWWDKLRFITHGKVQVKLKNFAIDVLTHTSQISEECLRLSMDTLFVKYTRKDPIQLLMQDIVLSRLVESVSKTTNGGGEVILEMAPGQTAILKIPIVEGLLGFDWNSGDTSNDTYFIIKPFQNAMLNVGENPISSFKSSMLNLSVSINIPNKDKAHEFTLRFNEDDSINKIVDSSPVPIIHYQTKLFSSLISLPQLSHVFLSSRGLKPVSLRKLDKQKDKSGLSPSPPGNMKSPATPSTPAKDDTRPDTQHKIFNNISEILNKNGVAEEFSSYVDLVAFALNEQINKTASGNLLKFINSVNFKINSSNIRVLATNVEDAGRVVLQTRTNSADLYPLVGIQAVLRSLKYKSIFIKKKIDNLNNEAIKELIKNKGIKINLLRWASEHATGDINLVIASFFDGKNLLSLRPLRFEAERLSLFNQSMENPEKFNLFFFGSKTHPHIKTRLKLSNLVDRESNNVNHLFGLKQPQEFHTNFMRKPKFDFGSTMYSEKKTQGNSDWNKEFDFSSVGGFFKAKMVHYEQQKRQKIQTIGDKDEVKESTKAFKNFITVEKCKLLVGQNLSAIGRILVMDTIEHIKKSWRVARKQTKENKEEKDIPRQQAGPKQPIYLRSIPQKLYSFGLEIKNPQFSFIKEELGSQILFTSTSGFMIYSCNHHLPFDYLLQDPREYFCVNFTGLGIYMAPPLIDFHKKVFWIEDRHNIENGELNNGISPVLAAKTSSHSPKNPSDKNQEYHFKKGVLNKLVFTEKSTLIEFSRFKNKEFNQDFSKHESEREEITDPDEAKMWNGEPRNLNINFIFEVCKSRLNGQDFDTLLELPLIFLNIVAMKDSKDVRKQSTINSIPTKVMNMPVNKRSKTDIKPDRQSPVEAPWTLLTELNEKGKENVAKYLQEILQSSVERDNQLKKISNHSVIRFLFKKIDLTMTTFDSVPYLEAEFTGLTLRSRLMGNVSSTHTFWINDVEARECDKNEKFNHAWMPGDSKAESQIQSYKFGQGGKPIVKLLHNLETHKEYQLQGQLAGIQRKIFMAEQTIYNVPCMTEGRDEVWKAVHNLQVTLLPIEFHVSRELLSFFNGYLFQREMRKLVSDLERKEEAQHRLFIEDNDLYFRTKEENIRKIKLDLSIKKKKEKKENAEQRSSIVPTYYNHARMNDVQVEFHFNYPLLNLPKIKFIQVPTFERSNKFYSRSELFTSYFSTNMLSVGSSLVAGILSRAKKNEPIADKKYNEKEDKKALMVIFGQDR